MESSILPKVAVVLVNYNGHKDTVECLESLFRQNYRNTSIFVVDNTTGYDSLSYILDWANGKNESIDTLFPDIVVPYIPKPLAYVLMEEDDNLPSLLSHKLFLIKANSNRGFAAGNNVAVRKLIDLDFQYIWFLNNDCVVENDAVEMLITSITQKNSRIGLIGSVLYDYYERDKIQCLGGRFNSFLGTTTHIDSLKEEDQVHYPVGASLFVSIEFISNVGLMNEEYFLYYEELDWVLRGKRLGYDFKILNNKIVYHKEGQSTKGDNRQVAAKSEFSDLYSLRSRILFMKRFFPSRMLFVYLGFIIVIINRIRRGRFSTSWKVVKLLINGK